MNQLIKSLFVAKIYAGFVMTISSFFLGFLSGICVSVDRLITIWLFLGYVCLLIFAYRNKFLWSKTFTLLVLTFTPGFLISTFISSSLEENGVYFVVFSLILAKIIILGFSIFALIKQFESRWIGFFSYFLLIPLILIPAFNFLPQTYSIYSFLYSGITIVVFISLVVRYTHNTVKKSSDTDYVEIIMDFYLNFINVFVEILSIDSDKQSTRNYMDDNDV
mgnify:FL=1